MCHDLFLCRPGSYQMFALFLVAVFALWFLCSGASWLDKQLKNKNGSEQKENKLHFYFPWSGSQLPGVLGRPSVSSGSSQSRWYGLKMLTWLRWLCFSDMFLLKCLGPTSCFKANIRYFWKLVRNFNGCQGKSWCHLSLKRFWLRIFHLWLTFPAVWHWMKQLPSKTRQKQVGTFLSCNAVSVTDLGLWDVYK